MNAMMVARAENYTEKIGQYGNRHSGYSEHYKLHPVQIGWPSKVHSLTRNFQLTAVNKLRRCHGPRAMSAFGGKADIPSVHLDVRF
jgi:hypothetical protein